MCETAGVGSTSAGASRPTAQRMSSACSTMSDHSASTPSPSVPVPFGDGLAQASSSNDASRPSSDGVISASSSATARDRGPRARRPRAGSPRRCRARRSGPRRRRRTARRRAWRRRPPTSPSQRLGRSHVGGVDGADERLEAPDLGAELGLGHGCGAGHASSGVCDGRRNHHRARARSSTASAGDYGHRFSSACRFAPIRRTDRWGSPGHGHRGGHGLRERRRARRPSVPATAPTTTPRVDRRRAIVEPSRRDRRSRRHARRDHAVPRRSSRSAPGTTTYLTQDLAVIDLRARDLFYAPTRRSTGPWSRAGFAHPGPLYYWILGALVGHHREGVVVDPRRRRGRAHRGHRRHRAPRMGARRSRAVPAPRRRDHRARRSRSPDVARRRRGTSSPRSRSSRSSCCLAWSVVLGEIRRLPWLAVVGTFLVQTHIGYGLLLLRARRSGSPSTCCATARDLTGARSGRAITWSVGWLVVLWLPVLIDQLFVTGNIGADDRLRRSTAATRRPGCPRSIRVVRRARSGSSRPGRAVRVRDRRGVGIRELGASPVWLVTARRAARRRRRVAARRAGRGPSGRSSALVAADDRAAPSCAMAAITGDQFDVPDRVADRDGVADHRRRGLGARALAHDTTTRRVGSPRPW